MRYRGAILNRNLQGSKLIFELGTARNWIQHTPKWSKQLRKHCWQECTGDNTLLRFQPVYTLLWEFEVSARIIILMAIISPFRNGYVNKGNLLVQRICIWGYEHVVMMSLMLRYTVIFINRVDKGFVKNNLPSPTKPSLWIILYDMLCYW